MMRLKIPSRHFPGIRVLSELSNDEASAIYDTLLPVRPSLSPYNLISAVNSQVEFSKEKTQNAILALVSLYSAWALTDLSLDDFVPKVVNAARQDVKIKNEGDLVSLERNLRLLLQLERSVGVTARAPDVMTTFDHVFRATRVVSDLRPLFTTAVDPRPLAAVVTHLLKIEFDKNHQRQAFYVGMDSGDIERLQNVLSRALKKDEQLKSIAKSNELPVLDIASIEEDEL